MQFFGRHPLFGGGDSGGGGIPAVFPYDVPVLDGDGEDGTVDAWTVLIGAGPFTTSNGPYEFNGSNHIRMDATSAEAWWYQDFAIPTDGEADVDDGLVNFTFTWLDSSPFSDGDSYRPMVEFYDGSAGWQGAITGTFINPADGSSGGGIGSRTVTGMIPPGTRTIRLSFQGWRLNGTELSCYFDDIEGVLDIPGQVASLVYTNIGTGTSGWTGDALNTLSSWSRWAMSGLYPGSVASAAQDRTINLSADQITAIGAHTVTCFLRALAWNENADDASRIYVQFLDASSSVLGTLESTASPFNYIGDNQDRIFASATVPSGTEKIKVGMEWTRFDGAVLDAQIGRISVMLGWTP